MIDLTPLDVRKKRGDFQKALRGYEAGEVDTFLDLVAERLEELVKENITLRERSERLTDQVSSSEGREKAVQEALVTAQELRQEVRTQAEREAALILKEAEAEADRIVRDAEQRVVERRAALEELERKRLRFLRAFRSLLERELDVVSVEEGRTPLDDVEVELDLGGGRGAAPARRETGSEAAPEVAPEVPVAAPPEGAVPPLDAPVHDLAEAAAAHEEPSPDQPSGEPEERPAVEPDGAEGAVPESAPPESATPESAPPESATPRSEEDELWLSAILHDDQEGEERAG